MLERKSVAGGRRKQTIKSSGGAPVCTILPQLLDPPAIHNPVLEPTSTSHAPSFIFNIEEPASSSHEAVIMHPDSIQLSIGPNGYRKLEGDLQPNLPAMSSRPSEEKGPEKGGNSSPNEPWCLVLLGPSITNMQSDAPAVQTLAKVIDVDTDEAEELMERARDEERVTLGVYETKRECMVVAQQLRDAGFRVRAKSGTPDTPTDGRGGSLRDFAKSFSSGNERLGILRLADKFQRQSSNGNENTPPSRRNYEVHNDTEFRLSVRREPSKDSVSSTRVSTKEPLPLVGGASPRKSTKESVLITRASSINKSLPNPLGQSALKSPRDSDLQSMGRGSLSMTTAESMSSVGENDTASSVKRKTIFASMRRLSCTLVGSALKDACKLVRVFIFGDISNETLTTQREREYALIKGLQEALGSRSAVTHLYGVWEQIARNREGLMNITDFRSYAQSQENLSAFEVEKLEALFFANDAQALSLKDLLSLVWPSAGENDLGRMLEWCAACKKPTRRAETPPALRQNELEYLRANFAAAAGSPKGKVKFAKLVKEGIIEDYQCEDCFRVWDGHEDAFVDLEQFCEMMCPAGFRAHENSKIGRLADGRVVCLNASNNQWYIKADAPLRQVRIG